MLNIVKSKALIQEVISYYPDLTYGGYAVGGGPKRSLEQRAAEIRQSQREMLTSEAVDQFRRCCDWLDRQPRTDNINRRAGTSYGLKEEVEAEGGYVSNGMFIASAVGCGYLIEQAGFNSRNAWLNISAIRASNPNLHLIVPHARAARLIRGFRKQRQRPL